MEVGVSVSGDGDEEEEEEGGGRRDLGGWLRPRGAKSDEGGFVVGAAVDVGVGIGVELILEGGSGDESSPESAPAFDKSFIASPPSPSEKVERTSSNFPSSLNALASISSSSTLSSPSVHPACNPCIYSLKVCRPIMTVPPCILLSYSFASACAGESDVGGRKAFAEGEEDVGSPRRVRR